MKSLPAALIALSLMLVAIRAEARDSTCLLGDDGKIAVTTLEHRAENSHRVTEVTLIFGAHFLSGQLKDADSGKVTLREKGADKNSYTFSGIFGVDYKK